MAQSLTQIKNWEKRIYALTLPTQSVKQRFWLLKSEPSCFSFADLQARPDSVEHWDGVRNFQARNFLRDEIKVGDGVLFYHSNIPEPAIVGVARVVRAGYPDFTARDPENEHFDPRATDADPIWYMVDVQAIAPLSRPLTRQMLLAHPLLGGMAVLKRGNRLSVQEVTAEEWRIVLAAGGIVNELGGN
ncbi:MAG: EVE domain-containing protein [Desulfuromonadales bacterium]|nr:EVE domain-containing protein [Desulfuromonadales bacterium]